MAHQDAPMLSYYKGCDQCRQAKNKKYVEDIAAYDISQRNIGLISNCGLDAYRKFGWTCAERYDCQSNDQRRNVKS